MVVCEEVGRQRSGILGVGEELVIVLAFLQQQENLSMQARGRQCWRDGGAQSRAGHSGQDVVQAPPLPADDGSRNAVKICQTRRPQRA